MIKSFHIKNIATYDTNGVLVNELNKINFFYGGNGCGKTTISNYLTNTLEHKYSDCSINWENNRKLEILVYNKAFREKNFGSSEIAGIFTLGQAPIEELEIIKLKRTELDQKQNNIDKYAKTISSLKEKIENHRESFTNKCWLIYKKNESIFKEALKGNIGSKLSFKERILSEYQDNKNINLLDLNKLIYKSKTLLGKRPITYDLISKIPENTLVHIEKSSIWKKNIIGKSDVDIAKLISKLENNDWVNEGRKYLGENSETCPFCQQQTINKNFRLQLEDYFDKTFIEDTEHIKKLSFEYKNESINLLEKVEDAKKNASVHSDFDIENFESNYLVLKSIIEKNTSGFYSKIDKTSLCLDISSTHDIIEEINKTLTSINLKIKEHNTLASSFEISLKNFKNEVWRYLSNEIEDEIKEYLKEELKFEKANKSIEKQIDENSKQKEKLDIEIKNLSRNMTSVQPTVDEINRLLDSYGFTNFKIVPSKALDNHYCIQRINGENANDTLSEGEVTFITFLYFYQLAKGSLSESNITNNKILVIDDPISSLDSNILYIVSSLVKKIIYDIKKDQETYVKQLILLTHNVYFHKEVSFQNGRSNGCNKTNFWILRKSNSTTSVTFYGQKNPIESSYELLWKEIKEVKLNSCVTIQNTMRRILENYFKILGKLSDEDIIYKFDNPQSQQVCRSLLHWINDGSHCIPDDLYIQHPYDSTDIYLSVFKDIFKHTGHESHYDMMMCE